MIIPARWYVSGRELDEFRVTMLHDRRIRILHDFPDASMCFPGVEIKGGVCYFCWDRDYVGDCNIHTHLKDHEETTTRPLLEDGMDTFIRTNTEIRILDKVRKLSKQVLTSIMESGRYFGYHTQVLWNGEIGTLQTADGKSTFPIRRYKQKGFDVKVYIAHGECWIAEKMSSEM